MMLLAAIEHAVRRFRATVAEALTDRARGFSDREAGDFLTADESRGVSREHAAAVRALKDRHEKERCEFVEREAEEEVAEPGGVVFNAFDHAAIALLKSDPDAYFRSRKTSGNTAADNDPHNPSPTIASRLPSRSVRDEGSPADCDIPQSPAGERPKRGMCRECGDYRVVGKPCTTCLLGSCSGEPVYEHLNAARQFIFEQYPPNSVMALEKLFHAVLALAHAQK